MVKPLSTLPAQVLEPLCEPSHSRSEGQLPAVGFGKGEGGDDGGARELLTAQGDESPSRCQRMGHPHVVRLGGQLIDQLVIADHRDQARGGIGQRQ
jgi:hypothetical protein